MVKTDDELRAYGEALGRIMDALINPRPMIPDDVGYSTELVQAARKAVPDGADFHLRVGS